MPFPQAAHDAEPGLVATWPALHKPQLDLVVAPLSPLAVPAGQLLQTQFTRHCVAAPVTVEQDPNSPTAQGDLQMALEAEAPLMS